MLSVLDRVRGRSEAAEAPIVKEVAKVKVGVRIGTHEETARTFLADRTIAQIIEDLNLESDLDRVVINDDYKNAERLNSSHVLAEGDKLHFTALVPISIARSTSLTPGTRWSVVDMPVLGLPLCRLSTIGQAIDGRSMTGTVLVGGVSVDDRRKEHEQVERGRAYGLVDP